MLHRCTMQASEMDCEIYAKTKVKKYSILCLKVILPDKIRWFDYNITCSRKFQQDCEISKHDWLSMHETGKIQ